VAGTGELDDKAGDGPVRTTVVAGGASGNRGAQAATEAMRRRRRLILMSIAVESPEAAPS